ncbi:MAG: VWA domain-containing protein [Rhodobacteraceae bacterium]|nr:VWA domain-containing protein [Paracoccaceae bacterium]
MTEQRACLPESGRLVNNVVLFVRALRRAGLPVGSSETLLAVEAVSAAGFSSKQDLYWTLHASLVTHPDQRQVFRQAFRLFWRDPRFHEQMMSMLLPMMRGVAKDREAASGERRAAEALLNDAQQPKALDRERPDDEFELQVDASGTTSARERLGDMDFEQMTAAEMAEANEFTRGMSLPFKPLLSRRRKPHPLGRFPDWRKTMRRALATGGEFDSFRRRTFSVRWPVLVALCDISGSMSAYSRTMLHFLHCISHRKGAGWAPVHSFTFGTTLTNITRQMRMADVDDAMKAAGREAHDWDGGTRIADCVRKFNVQWSRRVMGQGAIVLLITDGLESGDIDLLDQEIRRLRRAARRLIWINPLLRWEQFAPKARGIRTMLPHVDCFRSAHSINSLSGLAEVISDCSDSGDKDRLLRRMSAQAMNGEGPANRTEGWR